MHSTQSRVSSRPSCERGSTVVEFAMVAVLLSALFLIVLQVGIYLYQRSVIASSVLAAARYAANANVSPDEGAARASELISQALSPTSASGLACTSTDVVGDQGVRLVSVRCTGSVPSIVAALGEVLPIDAQAQAIKEGS